LTRQHIRNSIFLFLGLLICASSIFFDFITGNNNFRIGYFQILGLVVGVLFIFIGFFSIPERVKKIKLLDFIIPSQFSVSPKVVHKLGRIIDFTVALLFLVIALAFFLGRWKGANPVLDLGSDAANVATFAAVLDHPENFRGDIVYSSTSNFSFYVSAHIPITRFLSRIFGGYGLAYLVLLVPIIFIQQLGFYFLGKKMFRNRFWALLLSILSLVIVYTESSDYWGVYKDPQPRMLFGALLPWLLFMAYSGFGNKKMRYITMVMIGLMIYIHPVSTPAIAFAIWLAYLVIKSKKDKLKDHFIESLFLGMVFVCVAIPFILIYLHGRDVSSTQVDYSVAITAFGSVVSGMFTVQNVTLALLKTMSVTLLLPLAVISWFISYFKFQKKLEVRMILLWIIGICFVSVGLTTIETAIDSKIQALPVLLDLTRSLRYLIPLLEISILFPLSEYTSSVHTRSIKGILSKGLAYITGLCICALLVMGYRNVTQDKLDMHQYAQQTVKCWSNGEWYCSDPSDQDLVDTLVYISKNTESNASFISIPPVKLNKVLRYQALRSVVFDPVDMNTFLAVDLVRYFDLLPEKDKWQTIGLITDQKTQFEAYLDFAEEHGAEYAVISVDSLNFELPEEYSLIFSAGSYGIIQIK